jgi:hypothetical protein
LADFREATAAELKALRGLRAMQRRVRRLDVRLATNSARVRVARSLKAVRGMSRLTDLRWHAQITTREAQALTFLARGTQARRVFVKLLSKSIAKLT